MSFKRSGAYSLLIKYEKLKKNISPSNSDVIRHSYFLCQSWTEVEPKFLNKLTSSSEFKEYGEKKMLPA